MSNMNTVNGFYNLPKVANPGTTAEFAYPVPATGVYAGLPSPTQTAANALVLSAFPGDLPLSGSASSTAASVIDGRPFKIRVCAVYNSHSTQNLTVIFRQTPATNVSAGQSTSSFTSTNTVFTSGALAAGNNIQSHLVFEAQFIWDAISGRLDNYCGIGSINGTMTNSNAFVAPSSQVTSGGGKTEGGTASVVGLADLNFIVTFTFASGTSADYVIPSEFVIERV